MKLPSPRPALLLVLCLLYFPLFAAQPEVDFKLLKQFAQLSLASYQTEDERNQSPVFQNFQIIQQGNIPQLEVRYLIARNRFSDEWVIAVRGTSNIDNALVDIAIKLQADEHAGIKIHQGFAQAASAIFEEIQPLLQPHTRIHLTGHSLGGAIAQVLAMYLQHDGYQVGHIITFGQPKVTNFAGSQRYAMLDLIRVVTARDLVPLVPPLDPLDIQNLDIYWHSGREVLLNSDNSYSVLQGVNSMLRATRFTQQLPDQENLHNHKMDLYLKLTESMMQQSERVPFKNDFNLFNLFGE